MILSKEGKNEEYHSLHKIAFHQVAEEISPKFASTLSLQEELMTTSDESIFNKKVDDISLLGVLLNLRNRSETLKLQIESPKEYVINLSRCYKITQVGFRALVSIISEYFVGLQTFEMNLSDCQDFNDSCLEKLATQVFRNLPHLQELTLYLNGY